ncbi:hypothetical protein SKAU_G00089300 [Synaphobranchus kaupii]|uniref:Uncharacterized protein n=1 Tax=Synaphobranchus kaupii TaxID=118154 RepID=A0A9Q1FWT8_SYNKA|nr:hypothetical protein SKAU_G00089300 [Synaphobranchus kaupii]
MPTVTTPALTKMTPKAGTWHTAHNGALYLPPKDAASEQKQDPAAHRDPSQTCLSHSCSRPESHLLLAQIPPALGESDLSCAGVPGRARASSRRDWGNHGNKNG